MGPTHCNFRKHSTCETHWKTARKALDTVGSWILCGRFVFHCLCSLWKHFLCGLLLSSARHNLQFTSYYFILLLFLCVMHFVLFACVSSEVAASRGHVLVFALPFISYLYHWFLFALLCLHCGERAEVQMIVHCSGLCLFTCFSAPRKAHLSTRYLLANCSHYCLILCVHTGNDSILQYDWGLIFIPSCR